MQRQIDEPPADAAREAAMTAAREVMAEALRERGVSDPAVLAAMRSVRRHAFFPGGMADPAIAYGDFPYPIGWGATISQPFIVAYMTQRLGVKPGARVLEVGTGSGYQAAVLASAGAHVWSLDVVPELVAHARRALAAEGFGSVRVRCADGYEGWAEAAPFDAILVTCAPPAVPEALAGQLAEGGRMLLPVGRDLDVQELVFVRRAGARFVCAADLPVRFVPMVRGATGAQCGEGQSERQ